MNSKDWVLRHHHERTVERWKQTVQFLQDELRIAYSSNAKLISESASLRGENMRLQGTLEDEREAAREQEASDS